MSEPNFSLRWARPAELDWINQRYAEVDFVRSTARDRIALAEIDGAVAGFGRMVPLAPGVGELGGMLVFEDYKGRGVARRLIAFLLAQPDFQTVYCLPFAELESLYAGMGFAQVPASADMPRHVIDKYGWCNTHYGQPVLLMRTAIPPGVNTLPL
ncbi:MAG TPA: GNAT family N-acetyltransferase [Telluria sp.]|nr:GNAT family N-acetyltransferase [Telluria sp.]